MERLPLFATAARGTEDLLADELTDLGAKKVRQDRGGVRFLANLSEALNLCLWTRIAMRVLYPLAETTARGAEGLYAATLAIPWEEHLTPRSTFAIEASLKDSEHSHSGFVALKMKDAVVDRLREKLGQRPDVDTHDPDVRVVAHLAKEKLSVSLDLCGEPLHRRGYRAGSFEAPLKETLAAAILRAAGYTGDEPLLDPMCGSGTLVIEAALIALRRAPNGHRRFGVERWPNMGAKALEILKDLRADAARNVRKAPFPIIGRDRSEEALEASRLNVQTARVRQEVQMALVDATVPLSVDSPPGLIVTNPPYGDRLQGGGQKGMKSFYYKLGESFAALPQWRKAILSGNPAFESAFHQRPAAKRTLWNGPIECELLLYSAKTPVAAHALDEPT
jgi:23S rRNA (guanine2445-N2)-methyltransferase / 23S rRNA (guanine2069-N7)-methyltransferase